MAKRNKPQHYKPEAERKIVPISLRVTSSVHETLIAAARKCDLTLSRFVEEAALVRARKAGR